MRTMFQTMRNYLSHNEPLVLVTVIASSGATPRGAGARMLVGKKGRICGTIGGGAVEYRAIQLAGTVLEEQASVRRDFQLHKDDVEKLGMICGGSVDVFFHYLPAGDPTAIAVAETAEAHFAAGRDLWFITDVCSGSQMGLYTAEEGFFGMNAQSDLPLTRHPERFGDLFVEQIHSRGRVYVFGGGHVAQELVPVLTHVGFRCVVVEDREEFARKDLFPTAEEIILCDMYRIGDFMRITEEDYVCVMTRGHAHDTVVQAQILRCHPCYCGVIGSIHKAAGVRKVLKEEHGLSEAELDLITTPIGLPIKGETPAEIAISICAQMILHRAERNSR